MTTVTMKDIERANNAIEAAETEQEYDDAWRPIAERLYKQPCPQDLEGEADGYGSDYAGALPTGELVIWQDIQGSRRSIFRVIRVGS